MAASLLSTIRRLATSGAGLRQEARVRLVARETLAPRARGARVSLATRRTRASCLSPAPLVASLLIVDNREAAISPRPTRASVGSSCAPVHTGGTIGGASPSSSAG